MLKLKTATRLDVDLEKVVRCDGCAQEAQWSLVTSCSHSHSFLMCDQCRQGNLTHGSKYLNCVADGERISFARPGTWLAL